MSKLEVDKGFVIEDANQYYQGNNGIIYRPAYKSLRRQIKVMKRPSFQYHLCKVQACYQDKR